MSEQADRPQYLIVIGASAGGLNAVIEHETLETTLWVTLRMMEERPAAVTQNGDRGEIQGLGAKSWMCI